MMHKILPIAVLGLLTGCTPLPTTIRTYVSPRPVDPTPYEKQGLVPAEPAAKPIPGSQIKLPPSVTVKPGQKLSDEEIKTLLAQADDKAVSASNLSRVAQSKDDWKLVIDRWKVAIDILKPAAQIPQIRQQLSDYESNLADAQVQAKTNPRQLEATERSTSNGIPLTVQTPSPSPSPSGSPSPSASPSASPSPSPAP
jgi:hypothetical protein